MGNYKSNFTGPQVDDGVDTILNKGIRTISNAAIFRDGDGNFTSLNSLPESEEGTAPSLVTSGEKYVWNRMIPLSEKDSADGVATLDANGIILMKQLPNGIANGIADLDAYTKVPMGQLHHGEANGVADLGADGKVPKTQLYGGEANGFAQLDENRKVLDAQLKIDVAGGYAKLDNSVKILTDRLHTNESNGVLKLDSNGKVADAQLNIGGTSGLVKLSNGKVADSQIGRGAANGVASLDGNSKIPATQMGKGENGGVASLGNDGKVPDAQLGRALANGVASLDSSGKIPATQMGKGEANGVASLDGSGKVPSSQLPSYVDDVVEYASVSNFPATGENSKIYVALDTNKTYRWSGSEYVEISASLTLGTTSTTAYRGDLGVTASENAATALTNANTAVSTANAASTKAKEAYTLASNVSTVADRAEQTANAASETADTAYELADEVSGQATQAVSTANTASANASTALTAANTALAHANAKGSAFAQKFYKIGTNSEGHVTQATEVTKSDITALGIPETRTSVAVTSLQSTGVPVATIVVDGQTYQLYARLMDKDELGPNTSTNDGYVPKGQGQVNKVWATDVNGAPDWRDKSNSIDNEYILDKDNWDSNNTQTITVVGATATNTIIVSPIPNDADDYSTYQILCTTQANSSLTFTCNSVPENDLHINILVVN